VTPSESPYRFEQTDGCAVISLLPELNEAQWADIEKVGNDLLSRLNSVQSPAFLVDLTSLNYMGSAMVALIVRLWKSAKERNGNMVVVNRHELVFEVLKLAGLTKLWTIVDSREKAMAELGVSGGGVFSTAQGGPGLLILGGIAVVGAIAGLALQLSGSDAGAGGKIAQAIEFGFAALGLVAGTMLMVREETSMRRNVGVFVLVACVVVVLAGILMAPDGAAPAPAAAPPAAAGAETPAPATAPPAAKEKKNKDKDDDNAPAEAPADKAEKSEAGAEGAAKPADADAAGVDSSKGLKINFGKGGDGAARNVRSRRDALVSLPLERRAEPAPVS